MQCLSLLNVGNLANHRLSPLSGSRPTPIAVFAFKRLDTLQKTLSALEQCNGFPGGPIYVFSDAPRESRTAEVGDVLQLRAWVQRWCSLHNAQLIEAPVNLGLRESIIVGVTSLLNEYERVIVLEDDIIVSPRFLEYMHISLDRFKDSSNVYQVSGYFGPNRRRLPDAGFLKVPACWGWATWRRAWAHYCDDASILLSEIERTDVRSFDIDGTYGYLDSLRRNANGSQNTWMVRWYASIFLRDGLTLYPSQSLTRNIGFTSDGTNCTEGPMGKMYTRQKVTNRVPNTQCLSESSGETTELRETLIDFYRWQNYQWSKPSFKERWGSRWRRLRQVWTSK